MSHQVARHTCLLIFEEIPKNVINDHSLMYEEQGIELVQKVWKQLIITLLDSSPNELEGDKKTQNQRVKGSS